MKIKIPPAVPVFIILFLFLPINYSHGKGIFSFSASETGSSVLIETPTYNVKIQKSPYSLSVLNGNKEILKNKAGASDISGSFFIRDDNKYHLLRILKWEENSNGISLAVLTDLDNKKANVLLRFNKNHIDVEWNIDDSI
ncbi:MAG TPA: hypothetical protein ENH82_00730, partial [bacterium]|nr:hypothetical protein [bacterium]